MKIVVKFAIVISMLTLQNIAVNAQPAMETGRQKMPDEWIDKDTHHKIIKLTRIEGGNGSFYFHNNPFFKNKMVFYNTNNNQRQIFTVDLTSLKTEQVTHQQSNMNGEIVGQKTGNAYYQVKDSVFSTNINTKQTKLLFVFPADYKGSISTINADETLFAGSKASDEQKEISKKYPEKSQFFNRIYDAHLPNDLFTINIKTKALKKIHSENTWLGHVQFSPTDPQLLMFCHEGPWEKVDRIWTINVDTKDVKLMHKRTMNMEIAGHEFLGHDGKTIWFDLQMPKGQTFFLAGTDIKTGNEKKYRMTRDEWSIHFNVAKDERMFCGDGGNDTQVAKAKDGMWIYVFRPEGDKFISEKLVMMKHHGYKLEPNVHFSPDEKWVIFRANFEEEEQVYAVEIKKSDK
jgi:oligogalacturonide lyase